MSDYVLYILMRTDLDSMNPGKAVAQGSHATNLFDDQMVQLALKEPLPFIAKAWGHWQGDRKFGTVIVLGCNEFNLINKIESIKTIIAQPLVADKVFDPTYPISDGNCIHRIPMITCGYIFGPEKELRPYLRDLRLFDGRRG